ncbi:TetR/AcrR family transcriptional regulator, partial [Micromonospora azadirachtae]
MTNTPARRRAPGMSPEQRREAVVRAALPLVAEHGASVTTAQVARMAGIGEATIFRVFTDKDELLDAVVAAALDPTTVLGELRSIPLNQPLADRLVEAADALEAHLGRMGTVLGALHASGHGRG